MFHVKIIMGIYFLIFKFNNKKKERLSSFFQAEPHGKLEF